MIVGSTGGEHDRRQWLTPVLLFSVLFAIHLPFVRSALQNGDSAVYNEQVHSRELGARTTHWGYLLTGVVFDTILPFDTDTNMNVLCVAFGAAGLTALYLVASRILGSPKWGALAVIAGVNYPYLRSMVLSEVDTVMCSLLLLSLASIQRRRDEVAGLLFGYAMAVSPLASVWLPVLLGELAHGREEQAPRWRDGVRRALRFALPGLVIYVPVLLFHWQDYLFGARGVLSGPRQPFDSWAQLERSGKFLWRRGKWVWALSMVGLGVALVGRHRRPPKSLAWGLFIGAATAAITSERFLDVPIQLPTLALSGIFLIWLLKVRMPSRLSNLLLAVVLVNGLYYTYRKTADLVIEKAEESRLYREVRAASEPHPALLVGVGHDWDHGRSFGWIAYQDPRLDRAYTSERFRREATEVLDREPTALVWFLDPRPTGIAPWRPRGVVSERTLSSGTYKVLQVTQ